MKQIIVFLALLTACTTEPLRQFQPLDDAGSCFLIYGYAPGYCEDHL